MSDKPLSTVFVVAVVAGLGGAFAAKFFGFGVEQVVDALTTTQFDQFANALVKNEGFVKSVVEKAPQGSTGKSGLEDLPVGTILSWARWGEVGAKLPDGWALCDGRPIVENGAPMLVGGAQLKAPDLRESFLRGAESASDVGKRGGSNVLKPDGEHTPQVKVLEAPNVSTHRVQNDPTRTGNAYVANHSHEVDTVAVRAHDHGGDNQPKYYNVEFIIKYR
jgi:hypothetical protein